VRRYQLLPGAQGANQTQTPTRASVHHMHTTWDEAAASRTSDIFTLVRKNPKVSVKDLRTELDKFIYDLYKSPAGYEKATSYWASIGATAIELAQKTALPLTVAEVTQTLVRKQQDYGSENISRFGRRGLMVRMHDKVARLENLLNQKLNPVNESIHDNLLDVVGYATIGVMWEQREFLLPLKTR
jgi:hypothetical protein